MQQYSRLQNFQLDLFLDLVSRLTGQVYIVHFHGVCHLLHLREDVMEDRMLLARLLVLLFARLLMTRSISVMQGNQVSTYRMR